ncbi:MAG: alanine racemase [Muribaculaceae bacterium]|nr:alanine racemase [Muribaculaceae bacterium]
MITEDFLEAASRHLHLAVDSRAVYDPENTVFAALRTAVGDGHRFISELYARGVKAFIVDTLPEAPAPDATFYLVPNVAEALRELAVKRLEGLSGGIVVTGSVGKTTVKELLYCALLPGADVRRSPRSWNSGIGIPLAIWAMTEPVGRPDFFITEAGIDGPGQGARAAHILGTAHGVGVLTPITAEHDEAFASHAAKIHEKLDLLAGCHTIVYADTDPELRTILAERYCADKRIIAVADNGKGIYHALADAVLEAIGVEASTTDIVPVNKRREISEGSFGNIILRDHFTADYRSLIDALDFMRRHAVPSHPSVLALGNLLEDDKAAPGLFERCCSTARLFGVSEIIDLRTPSEAARQLARYHAGEISRRQILAFGLPDEPFTRFADTLESAGHDTTLEVDLDALVHNYNHYRRLMPPGSGLVAMVKASAYGMGAVEIGKTLQSSGAAYLAVAVIEEGIALRQAGITMPVMVLNPVTNRYPELFAHRLEPAVFSIDELELLIAEAEANDVKDYPVHIKLDTGMHRVGFLDDALAHIARLMAATDSIRVATVFSHLATADCLDMDSYTRSQIDSFGRMTDKLSHELGYPFKRHLLNTAGMMRFAADAAFEMGRLGIGLYGIAPYAGPDGASLKPLATFRTRIISLKHWPAGTPIGYGCKGHTTADSIIATVPAGYADGVNRHFGCGKATFKVKGVECPTIGNICMDLCMIDVTAVPDVAVGDSVEIFGSDMPVERLATLLDTIPYEILTSVSPRVKRVYITKR